MTDALKNLFNPRIINAMGDHLVNANPDFDRTTFVAHATDGLEKLELKARSVHIQNALDPLLPRDFHAACDMILASLSPKTDEDWKADDIFTLGISGWAVMPMAEIVAARGINDFDYAMSVLGEMTKRFTSEFAVRSFFIEDQSRAMKIAATWARSDNYHVRRLASEGARPRLPWGLRLQSLVKDPSPILPVLEILKDDPSEYVRRSVANALNDVAKDHPDIVVQIAGQWFDGASQDRGRLVKHACRSLIKSGHIPTLRVLGYDAPDIDVQPLQFEAPDIALGDTLVFSTTLISLAKVPQPLIIDYVVHHQKANGTTTAKTFKWKTLTLPPGATITLSKSHPFKAISTRAYHEGAHKVQIQINGMPFSSASFNLRIRN